MFTNDTPIWEFRGPWGVPIQIGVTLFLLPLLLVDFTGSPRSLTHDVLFVAILIASILLHELGHAWGCLIQGVPVRRIMLYAGGGFCEQSRSSSRYEQELIVAMGPIVNLTLWAVAGLAGAMVADPVWAWVLGTISWVNLYLALFNLLPVMPLDGGRLFALLLFRAFPPVFATRLAGFVGLALSVLWLPFILSSFALFGLALLLIPSFKIHWQMLTYAEA